VTGASRETVSGAVQTRCRRLPSSQSWRPTLRTMVICVKWSTSLRLRRGASQWTRAHYRPCLPSTLSDRTTSGVTHLDLCLSASVSLSVSVCLLSVSLPVSPSLRLTCIGDGAKRSQTTTNFVQRSLSVDGRITCNQRSPRQPASLSSTDCSVIFARWRPYVSHLIPSSSDPRVFAPQNGITIGSAVFARLTIVIDRQTDRTVCVAIALI